MPDKEKVVTDQPSLPFDEDDDLDEGTGEFLDVPGEEEEASDEE